MKYSRAQLTNTQAHAMHARQGKANGVLTLRKRQHWHAIDQPFPSAPPTNSPVAHPFELAKLLMDYIGIAWATLLTAPQRAAWSALAAVQQITKDDGTTKFVTGQRFFSWYWNTQYNQLYDPPFTPNLTPSFLAQNPPVWNPLAAPGFAGGITFLGTPFFYRIPLTMTPGTTISNATVLIPNPNSRTPGQILLPKLRIFCFVSTFPNPAGNFTIDVFMQGLIPFDGWHSGKRFTVRAYSTLFPNTPSPPATYTWA